MQIVKGVQSCAAGELGQLAAILAQQRHCYFCAGDVRQYDAVREVVEKSDVLISALGKTDNRLDPLIEVGSLLAAHKMPQNEVSSQNLHGCRAVRLCSARVLQIHIQSAN